MYEFVYVDESIEKKKCFWNLGLPHPYFLISMLCYVRLVLYCLKCKFPNTNISLCYKSQNWKHLSYIYRLKSILYVSSVYINGFISNGRMKSETVFSDIIYRLTKFACGEWIECLVFTADFEGTSKVRMRHFVNF